MSTDPGLRSEDRSCKQWEGPESPRRLLIIRMHAIGDVAITLPVAQALCRRFPNSRVDYLSSNTPAKLLNALSLGGTVFTYDESLGRWGRLLTAFRLGVRLRRIEYDIVFDLQRNWMSRLVRRIASPRAWSEFDRFSLRPAAERVYETIHAAGVDSVEASHVVVPENLRKDARGMLRENGWREGSQLIALNPAGLWTSRQWPLDFYVELAYQLKERTDCQFLLLGTERVTSRAQYISQRLGADMINAVAKTSLSRALAMLSLCSSMVTEDSGLMHMAWAVGLPSVVLLGSTNHHWSSPVGPRTHVFHSGDLPCADCMDPSCKYGDVHCLTRVTPTMVCDAVCTVARLDGVGAKGPGSSVATG